MLSQGRGGVGWGGVSIQYALRPSEATPSRPQLQRDHWTDFFPDVCKRSCFPKCTRGLKPRRAPKTVVVLPLFFCLKTAKKGVSRKMTPKKDEFRDFLGFASFWTRNHMCFWYLRCAPLHHSTSRKAQIKLAPQSVLKNHQEGTQMLSHPAEKTRKKCLLLLVGRP